MQAWYAAKMHASKPVVLVLALAVGCAGSRAPWIQDAARDDQQQTTDMGQKLQDRLPDIFTTQPEGSVDGPLTPELCDGKDNNGNNKIDEGTFLPTPWDGATHAPKGYFGTDKDYLLVLAGKYLYAVDLNPAGVKAVIEIASTDPKINSSYKGVSPPAQGYNGLAAVPKGTFSSSVSGDLLVFAHGTDLYLLTQDNGISTWSKSTIAAAFASKPYKPAKVDAADMLIGSLFGSKQDIFVIFDGGTVYTLTAKTSSIASAATALYPPGSTGPAPPHKIDAAFFVPNKFGIALSSSNTLHSAAVNTTTGALDWNKTSSTKGTFPCD